MTISSLGGSCMTSPGRQQRPRRLLARDHQVPEPGRESMTGVVALRAQFGGRTQGIGDALGRALIVRREGDAHVAVVEDGVVGTVRLLDLIQATARSERRAARSPP